MPAEERQTHKNLQRWMMARAQSYGVKDTQDDEEDDEDEDDPEMIKLMQGSGGDEVEGTDDGPEDEEEEKEAEKDEKKKASKKKEDEEDAEVGVIDKTKNWSSVNLTSKESKLNFRGVLTQVSFTNWLWYRCI